MTLPASFSAKIWGDDMGYRQLSEAERYAIARWRRQGHPLRTTANLLERSPSTISREVRRNATTHDGHYRPDIAQQYAVAKRHRSRRNLHHGSQDWAPIALAIRRKWSPPQIVGRARFHRLSVMSAKTIYRHLRLDRRQGSQLWQSLRIVSKFRRKRRGSPETRGRLIGKRYMSATPAARSLGGRHRHRRPPSYCVLTLIERASGFCVIKKLTVRNVQQANQAMRRAIKSFCAHFRTIILDNGTEFHGYEGLEAQTGVPFYFATPYRSWERRTNESTNRLIRQYLPKGSCFRSLTQSECDKIAKELKDRPRERLG